MSGCPIVNWEEIAMAVASFSIAACVLMVAYFTLGVLAAILEKFFD